MTWSNHNHASSQTAMHDLTVVVIMKLAESDYLSTFLFLFLLFPRLSPWISLSKTTEICRKTDLCHTSLPQY